MIQESTQQQTVLLTGATNQIGFFLLPLLLEQHTVIVISRQPAEWQHANLQWLQTDLQNMPANLQLDNVSTLFHIAPLLLLPHLFKRLPNLQRVIAFSSTSRFTKAGSSNTQEQTIASNLQAGEEQLEQLCQHSRIPWTLFRPTLVYGCARDKNVFFIARQIQRFGFFPLAGSGCGLRQPVHAHDLAQACLLAWHEKLSFNRAYNLSGAQTLSYAEMVTAIFRGMKKPPRLLKIPVWVFRVAVFCLRWLPAFRNVSLSMVERMNSNLCFEHSQATKDFAYQARAFNPDTLALGLLNK